VFEPQGTPSANVFYLAITRTISKHLLE